MDGGGCGVDDGWMGGWWMDGWVGDWMVDGYRCLVHARNTRRSIFP